LSEERLAFEMADRRDTADHAVVMALSESYDKAVELSLMARFPWLREDQGKDKPAAGEAEASLSEDDKELLSKRPSGERGEVAILMARYRRMQESKRTEEPK
jgi:hypothetical protein